MDGGGDGQRKWLTHTVLILTSSRLMALRTQPSVFLSVSAIQRDMYGSNCELTDVESGVLKCMNGHHKGPTGSAITQRLTPADER